MKKKESAVVAIPPTNIFGVPVARAIGPNEPSWDYFPTTTWVKNTKVVRPDDQTQCQHVFVRDGFNRSLMRCKRCDITAEEAARQRPRV